MRRHVYCFDHPYIPCHVMPLKITMIKSEKANTSRVKNWPAKGPKGLLMDGQWRS